MQIGKYKSDKLNSGKYKLENTLRELQIVHSKRDMEIEKYKSANTIRQIQIGKYKAKNINLEMQVGNTGRKYK